ncbi:MAG: methyltransferase domain-containing protein, partial [Thermocrispum sp.]
QARRRGSHKRLVEADVTATGLPGAQYDLVIASLVDEHLSELGPLYTEARRLARPAAAFVLVAFHPHFIMHTGMPTHFRTADGEDVAIATTVHLMSDHVAAAHAAGWRLAELREGVVDDRWVAVKPRWERHRGASGVGRLCLARRLTVAQRTVRRARNSDHTTFACAQ